MRRVVITGLGLVTPLGCGVDNVWKRLISSQSGIRQIDRFDVSDLPAKIGGLVPHGKYADGLFDLDEWVPIKDQRKMDRFIHYAISAARQAIEDSGWMPEDEPSRERTGVLIGSGIGGLEGIYETSLILKEQGPRRVSPFFIPSCLINLASGHVSIQYGFKGPNHAVVTACSTGTHAIGDAARLIQFGDADVMVAGGAEGAIGRIGMAGFASARSLSTAYNDSPEQASRPWDKDRDGFVMGDGAGVVILEDYEHAKKRGARIYAEVIGYGLSGDAFHLTSPPEDGNGAYRAMAASVKASGVSLDEIDYINAHATSTQVGDKVELSVVERFFATSQKTPLMSSTKSAIGHLLGATGSVEAIFCIMAITRSEVPPTLNLENSIESRIDLVPKVARQAKVKVAVSNSFGFGGTNSSLVLRAI
ncbi:MAG: beta-ketoacyl-ACP synthase II [Alphaproteobacteria bacterium]|nr:beta-ketoacyl-ACP synthase II [Alphaproteobacteria bacterium]OJV46481.1 MAG: beta-ketoacyl-[acyl-carrier-protein] synthase II [Alphaproteobacteria bacterium 43-37]